ncbi:hypothetical protein H696_04579 [Fonticula alba]|uniref:PH domain-containing protein n=1 Tax=Fonticula alba TaxID=691883 RepID=A0A058Z4G7_FONAL|nr:hypothetical protein H696_04579 [Fonticula alba]KCV69165.1 hypothetical protein H696_04579 [Fonticula alba]|eukprot:XP_009496736.1 hypothetical protein H696_04579 [Fonticula alba]
MSAPSGSLPVGDDEPPPSVGDSRIPVRSSDFSPLAPAWPLKDLVSLAVGLGPDLPTGLPLPTRVDPLAPASPASPTAPEPSTDRLASLAEPLPTMAPGPAVGAAASSATVSAVGSAAPLTPRRPTHAEASRRAPTPARPGAAITSAGAGAGAGAGVPASPASSLRASRRPPSELSRLSLAARGQRDPASMNPAAQVGRGPAGDSAWPFGPKYLGVVPRKTARPGRCALSFRMPSAAGGDAQAVWTASRCGRSIEILSAKDGTLERRLIDPAGERLDVACFLWVPADRSVNATDIMEPADEFGSSVASLVPQAEVDGGPGTPRRGPSRPSAGRYPPIAGFVWTGSLDGRIRVWHPSTYVCLATFKAHAGAVLQMAYSEDLRPGGPGCIWTVSVDFTTRAWCPNTVLGLGPEDPDDGPGADGDHGGDPLLLLLASSPPTALDGPDSGPPSTPSRSASGASSASSSGLSSPVMGGARRTAPATRPPPRPLRALAGHRSWVRCVAVAQSNGSCWSGSDDGTIRVWLPSLSSVTPVALVKGSSADPAPSLGSDASFMLEPTHSRSLTVSIPLRCAVHSLCYVPAVKPSDLDTGPGAEADTQPAGPAASTLGTIWAGLSSGSIVILDVKTLSVLAVLRGHVGRVGGLHHRPGSDSVYSIGPQDRTIRVWSAHRTPGDFAPAGSLQAPGLMRDHLVDLPPGARWRALGVCFVGSQLLWVLGSDNSARKIRLSDRTWPTFDMDRFAGWSELTAVRSLGSLLCDPEDDMEDYFQVVLQDNLDDLEDTLPVGVGADLLVTESLLEHALSSTGSSSSASSPPLSDESEPGRGHDFDAFDFLEADGPAELLDIGEEVPLTECPYCEDIRASMDRLLMQYGALAATAGRDALESERLRELHARIQSEQATLREHFLLQAAALSQAQQDLGEAIVLAEEAAQAAEAATLEAEAANLEIKRLAGELGARDAALGMALAQMARTRCALLAAQAPLLEKLPLGPGPLLLEEDLPTAVETPPPAGTSEPVSLLTKTLAAAAAAAAAAVPAGSPTPPDEPAPEADSTPCPSPEPEPEPESEPLPEPVRISELEDPLSREERPMNTGEDAADGHLDPDSHSDLSEVSSICSVTSHLSTYSTFPDDTDRSWDMLRLSSATPAADQVSGAAMLPQSLHAQSDGDAVAAALRSPIFVDSGIETSSQDTLLNEELRRLLEPLSALWPALAGKLSALDFGRLLGGFARAYRQQHEAHVSRLLSLVVVLERSIPPQEVARKLLGVSNLNLLTMLSHPQARARSILRKQTRHTRLWRRRLVVLVGRCLLYFNSDCAADSPPRGLLILGPGFLVERQQPGGRPERFTIRCPNFTPQGLIMDSSAGAAPPPAEPAAKVAGATDIPAPRSWSRLFSSNAPSSSPGLGGSFGAGSPAAGTPPPTSPSLLATLSAAGRPTASSDWAADAQFGYLFSAESELERERWCRAIEMAMASFQPAETLEQLGLDDSLGLAHAPRALMETFAASFGPGTSPPPELDETDPDVQRVLRLMSEAGLAPPSEALP